MNQDKAGSTFYFRYSSKNRMKDWGAETKEGIGMIFHTPANSDTHFRHACLFPHVTVQRLELHRRKLRVV